MKTHNYILIVLSACLLCSCAGQSNPYALDVLDKVTVVKTDKHLRIKGTCIFIVPPEGFVQDPMESVLINREGTLIRFMETIDRDVDKVINPLLEQLPTVYLYGKTGYWKSFKTGKNRLFFIHTTWDNNRNRLSFSFGNQLYAIMIGCRYPIGDRLLRDAIFRSMLTAYIDTTYRAESIKDFACFTVDLSDTEFKPAYYGANIYYYTINGVDPAPDSDIDLLFTIRPLPYEDPEKIMKFAIDKDTIFHVLQTHTTEINGYPTVECYSEGVVSGERGKGYSVVFGNGKTSLHFSGTVYNPEKYDEYLAEFKRIVRTIRFKEIDENP
ncbi:hypothetical protein [Tannerella sp.]|uniref:hypothetical protein n=1 Tax=Tannerella sp. TaxID=2382127 RepID=UPI003FA33C5B